MRGGGSGRLAAFEIDDTESVGIPKRQSCGWLMLENIILLQRYRDERDQSSDLQRSIYLNSKTTSLASRDLFAAGTH
jgi:hypothetical protein